MKICFVQPNTDYQIEKNRYALALTFPQLISDLGIEETDYVVYIFGKTNQSFEQFLRDEQPTHVFITAITSTFPNAEKIAEIAKQNGCTVVLGGLFASINYDIISRNFLYFDYIISGHPDNTLLSFLNNDKSSSNYIVYKNSSNYQKELGEIIIDKRFRKYYSEDDTVCYELTNGCYYNCSFCTMRHAFPNQKPCNRSLHIIKKDLPKLAKNWKKLKLIDDDICMSADLLSKLNLKIFDEVIAETRVDNISEYTIRLFSEVGITHLIVGIETFNANFLSKTRKTDKPEEWNKKIKNAIFLCQKYNIIIRPVIMIINEYTSIQNLKELCTRLVDWTPDNNIEVLCSFYTPHPGMASKKEYTRLLTNNLKYFDHLHCVWLPPLIEHEERKEIVKIYNEMVNITKSYEFNPMLELIEDKKEKYFCFFE